MPARRINAGKSHPTGTIAFSAAIPLGILFGILLGTLSGCDRPDTESAADQPDAGAPDIPEIRLSGPAFGTTYNIRIRLDPDGAAARRIDDEVPNAGALLEKAIQAEIENINAAMSNWHNTSEISRFNERSNTEAMTISEDFARVLVEAFRIHRISGGAFDPARDSLFALWGFGGGQNPTGPGKTRPAPDEAAIQATLQTSGMQHLKLNGRRLRKTRPELRLNLSAIAKGHAVDRVFALVQKHPLLNADQSASNGIQAQSDSPATGQTPGPAVMVEIGGEVRVGRIVDEDKPWRLGVERPQYDSGGGRSLYRIAELEHTAMATSGDYRNYFRDNQDDTLYSHIMDPRSGRPTATGVAQATVIGPNCMTADALATTLLVLGADRGLKLIESQPEYEALLLLGQPDGSFRAAQSSGMQRWLRDE